MTDTKVNVGTPGHIDHGTKDSGMPDKKIVKLLLECGFTVDMDILMYESRSSLYPQISITEPTAAIRLFVNKILEHSESYLQSRIAEAEERQRVKIAGSVSMYLSGNLPNDNIMELVEAILTIKQERRQHSITNIHTSDAVVKVFSDRALNAGGQDDE